MTKFTLQSTNESALSLIDNGKLNLDNESATVVAKNYFFQLFTDMSQYFYKFNRSKQFKPSTVTDLKLPVPTTTEKVETGAYDTSVAAAKLKISEAILIRVTHQLESFERNNGYLDKDLTLNSMAKMFGTNHSYLSKIVHLTKKKPFKSYLNDLRIEYAYSDLKCNANKRKYTIEAIAFDNGFRSAESFSKKFKQRYDIYPSKFVRELEA